MWAFYAALVALLLAARRMTNQHFKMPAGDLVLATKLIVVLLCIPILFVIEWPASPYFYLFTILTSPLSFYKDRKTYDFTANFGAGPLSRIEPLAAPYVFLVLLPIDHKQFLKQIEKPLFFSGIVFCLISKFLFTTRLRACPVNRQALKTLAPLVIASGSLNLLAKGCTENMPSESGIFVYIFIQSLLAFLIAFFAYGPRKAKEVLHFRDKRFLFVILGLAVSLVMVISLRLLAFKGADNPAYATSLMLAAPFWVLLFNRVFHYKEEGNIKDGIGIVFSAIALVFMTHL
jgi:hypothetical protein